MSAPMPADKLDAQHTERIRWLEQRNRELRKRVHQLEAENRQLRSMHSEKTKQRKLF